MARGRYDKYEPKSGGFRAALAADFTTVADLGKVQGVSLDASGRVVIGGAAAVNIKGVLVLTKVKNAGDIVDVMTDGEIVDYTTDAGAAMVAGTDYYSAITGVVSSTAASSQYVGHTVESTRLVVRVGRSG